MVRGVVVLRDEPPVEGAQQVEVRDLRPRFARERDQRARVQQVEARRVREPFGPAGRSRTTRAGTNPCGL